MYDLGKHILQKTQYAIKKLSEIKNIMVPKFKSSHFKEFIIDFDKTGLNVKQINKKLLKRNIFGGLDLTAQSADLKNCSLYCITEMHSMEDIDKLVENLQEILTKF